MGSDFSPSHHVFPAHRSNFVAVVTAHVMEDSPLICGGAVKSRGKVGIRETLSPLHPKCPLALSRVIGHAAAEARALRGPGCST